MVQEKADVYECLPSVRMTVLRLTKQYLDKPKMDVNCICMYHRPEALQVQTGLMPPALTIYPFTF